MYGPPVNLSTGKANNNKNDVTKIAQTNKGNLCQLKPGLLILIVVVIKFIA
jgi:hypothetical protein